MYHRKVFQYLFNKFGVSHSPLLTHLLSTTLKTRPAPQLSSADPGVTISAEKINMSKKAPCTIFISDSKNETAGPNRIRNDNAYLNACPLLASFLHNCLVFLYLRSIICITLVASIKIVSGNCAQLSSMLLASIKCDP